MMRLPTSNRQNIVWYFDDEEAADLSFKGDGEGMRRLVFLSWMGHQGP